VELDGPTREVANQIGEAEHYVLLLADGFGLNLVESLPEASFLRRQLRLELRSVFPSSTAPAITSLMTGLWPAEHGLLTWNVYLRERRIDATVLPFVERFSKRPLTELGVSPGELYEGESALARLPGAVRSLQPKAIADSVYTRYAAGGTAVHGYESLGAALEAVAATLKDALSPSFTYVYYPDIDAAEHDDGLEAESVAAKVRELEEGARGFVAAAAGRARLVVTADHGQITVPDDSRLVIEEDDDQLDDLLAPPSGEPRLPVFFVRTGREEPFRERMAERFGERLALLTAPEVEEMRLLGPGPLSPAARARLGDYVGLAAGREVLIYAREKGVAAMRGFHGGLHPDEARIPLIVA
jgi:hypothetical protein